MLDCCRTIIFIMFWSLIIVLFVALFQMFCLKKESKGYLSSSLLVLTVDCLDHSTVDIFTALVQSFVKKPAMTFGYLKCREKVCTPVKIMITWLVIDEISVLKGRCRFVWNGWNCLAGGLGYISRGKMKAVENLLRNASGGGWEEKQSVRDLRGF